MQNSKLIRLLKSFSKEELKEFEKFISSPFHGQKRDLVPFFRLIKKYYPAFDNTSFTGENLFKKLYPGKKYSEERMRSNNSFLFKMAADFLSHHALNKDRFEKQLLLLREFRLRGLDSAFEGLAKDIDTKLPGYNYSLEDYFSKRKDLRDEIYLYNQSSINAGGLEKDISKRITFRTAMFLTGYLRDLTVELILNFDYGPTLKSEVLEKFKTVFDVDAFFTKGGLPDRELELLLPLYYIYMSTRKIVAEGIHDKENFNKARTLFLKNIHKYTRQEKFRIFESLLNVYFINTSLADRSLINEEFGLVKLQFKHDAFTPDKSALIPPMQFRNIVIMGTDIKDFKWTETFINEYSKYLPPGQRNNVKYYSMAFLEYRRGNPGKALENSVKVKFDNFIFKRDQKILLLRLFYEQGLLEQAQYFLDTAKKYNRATDTLSEQLKHQDKNFMLYYGKLLNLTNKPGKVDTELLLNALRKEKVISNKAWLVRQFEAFL